MATKNSTTRFTLDMTADLRTRLKVAAARKGITMRQYSLEALSRQLARDDIQVQISSGFNMEAINKAKALQDSIFGNRRLTNDSTDIIRQAREERANQL